MFRDYIKAGWKLVPIQGKRPITKQWNIENNTVQELEEVVEQQSYGLAHAYSGTCCVDIDNLQAARGWFSEQGVDLTEIFGDITTVLIQSGRENRAKIMYALDHPIASADIKKDGRSIIDFRCKNANGTTQQDVLPPSIHPDTGQPYAWAGLGSWHRLPKLPTKIQRIWEQHQSTRVDTTNVIPITSSTPTEADLQSALQSIPPDCTYTEWVRVGMALHSVGSDYSLWDEWSALGSKYKAGECQKKWQSFSVARDESITIRSLFHTAREHGWAPDVDFKVLQDADERWAKANTLALALPTMATGLPDPVAVEAVRTAIRAALPLDVVAQNMVLNIIKKKTGWTAKNFEAAVKDLRRSYTAPGDAVVWKHIDAMGRPKCTEENVSQLLKKHRAVVRYNQMLHTTSIITIEGKPGSLYEPGESGKTDPARLCLEDRAKIADFPLDGRDFWDRVDRLAEKNYFHPFREYLNGHTWDGEPRLDRLINTIEGSEAGYIQEFKRMAITKWMLGVCALADDPPVKDPPRTVLVLQGIQHSGKSTWFSRISPPKMFTGDLHLDAHDKDSERRATESLIIELGELETTTRKSDTGALKAFISRRMDVSRIPYDRALSRRVRRTAIGATLNVEEFLNDETGNTRYLPVKVDTIDWDVLNALTKGEELRQLWLEINIMYKEGAPFHLSKADLVALQRISKRYYRSTETELVLKAIFDFDNDYDPEFWVKWTMDAVLMRINNLNRAVYKIADVRTALNRLSYQKIRKRDNGSYARGWMMPPLHSDNVKPLLSAIPKEFS